MRTALGVALLLVVAVLLGGCQVATGPEGVTMSPTNGATDVNPTSPVTVTVDRGKLTHVAVTNADGSPVAGALSGGGRSWKATERLGYGKAYSYSGSRAAADGNAT